MLRESWSGRFGSSESQGSETGRGTLPRRVVCQSEQPAPRGAFLAPRRAVVCVAEGTGQSQTALSLNPDSVLP